MVWFLSSPLSPSYYIKINEYDGSSVLIGIDSSTTYVFKKRGLGSAELGLKNNNTGWLITDRTDFIVYGEILGLKMLLNGSSKVPFKTMENADVTFKLETQNQPYQMVRLVCSLEKLV